MFNVCTGMRNRSCRQKVRRCAGNTEASIGPVFMNPLFLNPAGRPKNPPAWPDYAPDPPPAAYCAPDPAAADRP
jgi:hypothetical protein